MLDAKEMDEIEELIAWNLSFGIPIKDTLEMINRLEYLDLFSDQIKWKHIFYKTIYIYKKKFNQFSNQLNLEG